MVASTEAGAADDVSKPNGAELQSDSEQSSDSQNAVIRPGSRTKWTIAAIAACVLVLIIWNATNVQEPEEHENREAANSALTARIDNQYARLKRELATEVKSSAAATENNYADALNETRTAINNETTALAKRVAGLEQQLDVLKNQAVADHETQIAEIRSMLATQPADVASLRQEIQRTIRKYNRKWRQLSEDFGAGNTPVVTSANSIQGPNPPFQIVSMDLWDGKPQVSISENKKWHFLRVGDQRQGWTVVLADHSAGTIGLRDPNNKFSSITLPTTGVLSTRAADRTPNEKNSALSRLTVATRPRDAIVKIMNIKPKYHERMNLQPGAYDIQVHRKGYQTYRRWIRLGDEDRVLNVVLDKK